MFFANVGSIATKDVLMIDVDETINKAVEMIKLHNHRDIIIKNYSDYHVMTTNDLISLRLEGADFTDKLSSIYTKQVPLLYKNDSIITALNLVNKGHDYICVCDDDNSLYGLVTNSDIIASVDPQIMLDNLQLNYMLEKKYGYKMVPQTETMKHTIKFMHESNTECIIVTDNSKPVGIVTSKDVLRFIDDRTGEERPVSDYMSSPIKTFRQSITIKEALEHMQAERFKRIVVVDKEGHISGIITQQELIAQTYLKWSHLVKEHFSEMEELSLVLEHQNRQLVKMATKDSLTKINNRHAFEEIFEKEHSYAKRYECNMSVIMMDLDKFKNVNDTYGHNVGDYVLKEFTSVVVHNIRNSDYFARWGGEEFVLLLPNADLESAKIVGEKLRTAVNSHHFDDVDHITASFGIGLVENDDTLSLAIEKADRALYKAKAGGRDKVCIFS